MAIDKISSTSADKELQDYDFATRGSVVESFVDYNNEIKKSYYDKAKNDSQLNTLQESVAQLARALDRNTKTIGTFEDKSSIKSLVDDNGNKWSMSGIIEKVNILSNIVSGGASPRDWTNQVHGNNVGNNNSMSSVPVIGTTKVGSKYELKDNGLFNYYYGNWSESTNPPSISIDGYEKSLADRMVLSESQIISLVENTATRLTEIFSKKLSEVQTETTRTASNSSNAYTGILAHINTIGVPAFWPVSVVCTGIENNEYNYKFGLVNGNLYGPINVSEKDWAKAIVSRNNLICHQTDAFSIVERDNDTVEPIENTVSVTLPINKDITVEGYTISYTIYSDENLQGNEGDLDDLPDFKVIVPKGLYAPKLCGTDVWFTKNVDSNGEAVYSQFDFAQPIINDVSLYTRMYTKENN